MRTLQAVSSSGLGDASRLRAPDFCSNSQGNEGPAGKQEL